MPQYVFSVDKIEIINCRSKGDHNDSDWLTLFLKVNNNLLPPVGPISIGTNVHAGDGVQGPWWLGPVEIADADDVHAVVVVTNHSHLSDINDQRSEAIKVESAASGAIIGTAVGGPVGAAIGLAIAGLGEVLGWLVGKANPNCNGEILTATFDFPPGQLTQKGTPQRVSNDYTAISRSECGNPPHTKMAFSVIDPFDWRQFAETHHIPLDQSLRQVLPPGVSLRSFEGMTMTFPKVDPDHP